MKKIKIKSVQKFTKKTLIDFSNKAYTIILKPASFYARKIFEFKHIQRALGLLIVTSVFSMAIVPNSVAGLQTEIETVNSQITSQVVDVITEKSIRIPVDNFTITQGYHLFHPGLDLAAYKGSPIYPIMDGVVVKVGYERFAYGNHVVVDHGSGIKSLYAHMSKIEVKEGEKVTKDSIVGLIGSTGWSTGPHLHLQIEQNGKWTNPRAFFEGYFGKRLASTR